MRAFPLAVALFVLGACGTPRVAEEYRAESYLPEELRAALADESPARRADAAQQVEKMEPARRKAVLIELTTDDRSEVRLLAVGLLERHHGRDPEIVARLAEVLSLDPDANVRAAAISALSASGRKECLTALLDALLNDPSLAIRKDAAAALDRLTGQSFGGDLVRLVDQAGEAADEAVMSYDDWLEANRDSLRWDPERERFRKEGGEP